METIRLYRNDDYKWVVDEDGVPYPVTFVLVGNGWSIGTPETYSAVAIKIKDDTFVVHYDGLGIDYIIAVDPIEDDTIYVGYLPGVVQEQLVIPVDHPAAQFFFKTKGTQREKITHRFDRQKYGVRVDVSS